MFFSFILLAEKPFKYYEKQKKDNTKETEEKQNSITIMIFVDGKVTVFPVKLKLE